MARTIANAVKAVLLEDYDNDTSPNLKPYIDTANAVVTRVNTCAVAKGLSFTTAELELLERWLAAHYYQQSDRGYTARSTADGSGSFQGQTGMYFESTMYGQTALQLDFSGCLAALGKRKAQGYWLGKAPSEQIDYDERD